MASQQLNFRLRTEASAKELVLNLLLSPIGLRLLGILFSIIVFGCVSDQADLGDCRGYSFSDACSFAVAVGVIAFLICLVLLIKDIVLIIVDFSEAIKVKVAMCLGDAIIGGFWAFMWFVCFCFTADQKNGAQTLGTNVTNCVNAGIAFSFFSILVWIAIVVFNVFLLFRIFRGTDGDMSKTSGSGYASFPDNQPPPSGYDDDKSAPYNPPEY